MLSGMKCQLAQGFLFSKPLHKEKMEELIGNMDRFACLNPHLRYSSRTNDDVQESSPKIIRAFASSGLRRPFK